MISELLDGSALTVTSFSFWSHGIGFPRRSRGMGGSGYSLSIAWATSTALATFSGNRKVIRSGPSSRSLFSSSTNARISSNNSGCALTISVFVDASARTSTGLAERSLCGRLAYWAVSICAIATASAVRNCSNFSGGRSVGSRRSRRRT